MNGSPAGFAVAFVAILLAPLAFGVALAGLDRLRRKRTEPPPCQTSPGHQGQGTTKGTRPVMHLLRRITLAIAAFVPLALAAPAAQANVASATPIGTFYSQYLGGHIAASTVRIDGDRMYVASLPNLTSYTSAGGPADSVVIGGLIVQNTNGGAAYGEGLVWNDPAAAPTCTAQQWVLEGGTATVTGPTPILISSLTPLKAFGSDQCFNPGSAQFFAIVQSVKYHEVYFTNGSSEANSLVTLVDHGVYHSFWSAGAGVDTSTGADAGLLSSGTLASFTNMGLSVRGSSDKRIGWDSLPTYRVVGTVSGNQNSPSNPVTLLPNPGGVDFGKSSSNKITVP